VGACQVGGLTLDQRHVRFARSSSSVQAGAQERTADRSEALLAKVFHRHDEESTMNATYIPIRPLFRCLFAAAALSATLGCGAFIDGLARTDATGSLQEAGVQIAKARS
jgi:hypothetical protein